MRKVKQQKAIYISLESITGKESLCYLFLIFLMGSMAGWIYEEFFYWITEGMLRNRGILYGPWLPIYGIGALCIYAMKPLKKKSGAAVWAMCHHHGCCGVCDWLCGYQSFGSAAVGLPWSVFECKRNYLFS